MIIEWKKVILFSFIIIIAFVGVFFTIWATTMKKEKVNVVVPLVQKNESQINTFNTNASSSRALSATSTALLSDNQTQEPGWRWYEDKESGIRLSYPLIAKETWVQSGVVTSYNGTKEIIFDFYIKSNSGETVQFMEIYADSSTSSPSIASWFNKYIDKYNEFIASGKYKQTQLPNGMEAMISGPPSPQYKWDTKNSEYYEENRQSSPIYAMSTSTKYVISGALLMDIDPMITETKMSTWPDFSSFSSLSEIIGKMQVP